MPLTRDQKRALYAYDCVNRLRERPPQDRDAYEIAIKALGANILRSGLSAALADLMRRKSTNLINDLAKAGIPRLQGSGDQLFRVVNDLDVGDYMLATREALEVATWLKRACVALLDEEGAGSAAAVSNGGSHAQ